MPDDFSDTDKAELRALARERSQEEWLRQKRKARWDTFKTWAQWLAAISVAKGIVWDGLSSIRDFVTSHWK